jgi:hypothetical protein
MKDTTIILRVEESLKKTLQTMADKDSRKLGDFIRLQLEKIAKQAK